MSSSGLYKKVKKNIFFFPFFTFLYLGKKGHGSGKKSIFSIGIGAEIWPLEMGRKSPVKYQTYKFFTLLNLGGKITDLVNQGTQVHFPAFQSVKRYIKLWPHLHMT